MENISIKNLSFTYPKQAKRTLENINFTVNQGEFLLLCGKSGCGKTTLLKLLKPSLSPFGKKEGNIYFNAKLLTDYTIKEQASKIGFVMQNPDNQIVTDKVWHELAFGLESLGYKQNEIRTRVSEMASFFGIQNWFYKNVCELSGGQKQLLNLASIMVMQPSVLILDEPTSQLDPIASEEFLNVLERINRELGTTVILAEHCLEDAFSMADRIIVMDNGKVIADDNPKNIGEILKSQNHDMYKALPTPLRVYGNVPNNLPCPLTVREGRMWLLEYSKENVLNPDIIPKDIIKNNNETVIEVKDAYFRYEKDLPDVVKGLDLTVNKGEIFCLLGGNGTGKSTAISLIAGLNKAYRGDVFIKGKSILKTKDLYNGLLGVLPQNPQSMFVKKTVYLDLMEILRDKKLSKKEKEQKVHNISTLLRIDNLLESHPYDLSGGEQQRVALSKILLTEPEILLLDEPTKGMDIHFKEEFADILLDLKLKGVTILMVSHDLEFSAKYADRCALMFDGKLTSCDTPREFFKGKNFYTTSANRMARTKLSDAVLAEDIILACGGKIEKLEKKTQNTESENHISDNEMQITQIPKSERNIAKKTLMALFIIFLLIPLTIYIGISFFGDRKYYFISILIILETIIPFCMMFEAGKPKARELVLISVLCAMAVAGRAAFFMLPEFKPVVALIIISGVCLGGEAGFLVGAVTAFVSNFFFGQGPWTPWQMFAFGIIGFISGILFKKGPFKRDRVSLTIFGFFATLVIYGGIMNPASVIMYQNKINWNMIFSSYVVGIPMDLIHSISTAFFLWILSESMIEKLERIKVKYGLVNI
ncbi:MAG: ATP-binding cassette domain-containing protein [Ruminococcaceae bacterium]|nr:ATP-binding cassette domain-containing protein [Oscillospiraceae bacterium]